MDLLINVYTGHSCSCDRNLVLSIMNLNGKSATLIFNLMKIYNKSWTRSNLLRNII